MGRSSPPTKDDLDEISECTLSKYCVCLVSISISSFFAISTVKDGAYNPFSQAWSERFVYTRVDEAELACLMGDAHSPKGEFWLLLQSSISSLLTMRGP
jgi:hypothetical protein